MATATQLTLVFSQTVQATEGLDASVCATCVNMMDRIGTIVIYHADTMNIARTYTNIQVTKVGSTTAETLNANAQYDATTKQLTFMSNEDQPLNMPEIAQIVFK